MTTYRNNPFCCPKAHEAMEGKYSIASCPRSQGKCYICHCCCHCHQILLMFMLTTLSQWNCTLSYDLWVKRTWIFDSDRPRAFKVNWQFQIIPNVFFKFLFILFSNQFNNLPVFFLQNLVGIHQTSYYHFYYNGVLSNRTAFCVGFCFFIWGSFTHQIVWLSLEICGKFYYVEFYTFEK